MTGQKFVTIYLLIIIFLNLSCIEKPTEQTKEDPGVILDYQWTVDTLYYTPGPGINGNTQISDIWGNSDTSVFAVGFDEWGGPGSMWKFNENKWDRIKVFTFEGGTFSQALEFNSLLGFSGNDIYAFGDHFYTNSNPPPNFLHTALAIHYNGLQWKELPVPSGFTMYGGSAYSSNNFYVGGTNGQLFHYYNGLWSVDTVKLSFFPNLPFYNVNPISCNNEGVYLTTLQYNENDGLVYHQFLLYSEKRATLIDSTTSAFRKWGGRSYWRSPSGKIFSTGENGIYQFQENKWIQVYAMESIVTINGTDDNHIFALASSGNIYFYNGKSWRVITTINKPSPVNGRVWCTEKGIFISVYYNNRTFVYHGFDGKEG